MMIIIALLSLSLVHSNDTIPRCRKSYSARQFWTNQDYQHTKCIKLKKDNTIEKDHYTYGCCARTPKECNEVRGKVNPNRVSTNSIGLVIFVDNYAPSNPCYKRSIIRKSREFCDLGDIIRKPGISVLVPQKCSAHNVGEYISLSNAMSEYSDAYNYDYDDDYYEEMEEEIAVEEELEDALADLMVERQSLLKREEALEKNIEAGLSIVDKKHLKQRLLN